MFQDCAIQGPVEQATCAGTSWCQRHTSLHGPSTLSGHIPLLSLQSLRVMKFPSPIASEYKAIPLIAQSQPRRPTASSMRFEGLTALPLPHSQSRRSEHYLDIGRELFHQVVNTYSYKQAAFIEHITRKPTSLASLDVINSGAVHPDAKKTTLGNL